jgi:hypothetical protein
VREWKAGGTRRGSGAAGEGHRGRDSSSWAELQCPCGYPIRGQVGLPHWNCAHGAVTTVATSPTSTVTDRLRLRHGDGYHQTPTINPNFFCEVTLGVVVALPGFWNCQVVLTRARAREISLLASFRSRADDHAYVWSITPNVFSPPLA